MNALLRWLLLRFCESHELDPQLIDPQLTYWENKKVLRAHVGGNLRLSPRGRASWRGRA